MTATAVLLSYPANAALLDLSIPNPGALACLDISVQCVASSVHCTVGRALYSVHCTVGRALYSVHCTVTVACIDMGPMRGPICPHTTALWTLYSGQRCLEVTCSV